MCTLYLIILQQQVSDVAAVVCGDLHKYCTNSRVPICIIRGLVDAVGFGESCLITLYLIPVMVTAALTFAVICRYEFICYQHTDEEI